MIERIDSDEVISIMAELNYKPQVHRVVKDHASLIVIFSFPGKEQVFKRVLTTLLKMMGYQAVIQPLLTESSELEHLQLTITPQSSGQPIISNVRKPQVLAIHENLVKIFKIYCAIEDYNPGIVNCGNINIDENNPTLEFVIQQIDDSEKSKLNLLGIKHALSETDIPFVETDDLAYVNRKKIRVNSDLEENIELPVLTQKIKDHIEYLQLFFILKRYIETQPASAKMMEYSQRLQGIVNQDVKIIKKVNDLKNFLVDIKKSVNSYECDPSIKLASYLFHLESKFELLTKFTPSARENKNYDHVQAVLFNFRAQLGGAADDLDEAIVYIVNQIDFLSEGKLTDAIKKIGSNAETRLLLKQLSQLHSPTALAYCKSLAALSKTYAKKEESNQEEYLARLDELRENYKQDIQTIYQEEINILERLRSSKKIRILPRPILEKTVDQKPQPMKELEINIKLKDVIQVRDRKIIKIRHKMVKYLDKQTSRFSLIFFLSAKYRALRRAREKLIKLSVKNNQLASTELIGHMKSVRNIAKEHRFFKSRKDPERNKTKSLQAFDKKFGRYRGILQ